MCTGARLIAENGDVVYGRTMEFDTPVPEYLGYFPRGQEFTGETNSGSNGMTWTNDYAFGGNVGALGKGQMAGADGLNEKGLIAGCLNLPGFTEFPSVTDANRDRALASWQIVLFVLGKYATTEEAKKGLLAGDAVIVDTDFHFTPTTKGQLPQHVRIGDASGKTIVVEWHSADEPPTVVESPGGCCTNQPRFEYHLDNWEHYKFLSPYNPDGPIEPGGSQDFKASMGLGYVGMPGGSDSPDRFIRASLYSRDAYPGKTGAETVWTAWHVMNNFDMPKGILRHKTTTGDESTEYTVWTSVADTKNLKYYFRVHENPAIYELDLNEQDPKGKSALTDNRLQTAPIEPTPVELKPF